MVVSLKNLHVFWGNNRRLPHSFLLELLFFSPESVLVAHSHTGELHFWHKFHFHIDVGVILEVLLGSHTNLVEKQSHCNQNCNHPENPVRKKIMSWKTNVKVSSILFPFLFAHSFPFCNCTFWSCESSQRWTLLHGRWCCLWIQPRSGVHTSFSLDPPPGQEGHSICPVMPGLPLGFPSQGSSFLIEITNQQLEEQVKLYKLCPEMENIVVFMCHKFVIWKSRLSCWILKLKTTGQRQKMQIELMVLLKIWRGKWDKGKMFNCDTMELEQDMKAECCFLFSCYMSVWCPKFPYRVTFISQLPCQSLRQNISIKQSNREF